MFALDARAVIALASLTLLACSKPEIPPSAPPRPTVAGAVTAPAARPAPEPPAFERVTVADAGVDAVALEALLRRGAETHSDAVVVLRGGKLLADERYGHEDGTIETMLATKSLVALVIGRLVDTGRLQSVDQPVHTFYPEWKQGKKQLVTIRHLLEQTSGLQANRTTQEIYASPDFVKLALAAELTSEPGTAFFYNNKAMHLLSGIVQIASGKRLDQIAREELFGPMGIDQVRWTRDKAGNPHAMSGAQVRPLDLAKIGQMMLEGGRWRGQQIVSEAWIRQTIAPSPKNPQYGFLTWIDHDISLSIDDEVIAAWRKARVDPGFVAKMNAIKGRVYPDKKSFFGAVATALGGREKLRDWDLNTWKRDLPDGKVERRFKAFRMDGYLGQHVVVIPKKGLVGVRMRRFRESEGDRSEYGFGDFASRLEALVSGE